MKELTVEYANDPPTSAPQYEIRLLARGLIRAYERWQKKARGNDEKDMEENRADSDLSMVG